MHNKYIKSSLIIMLIALSLCGCNRENDNISKYNTITIASIYDKTYGSCELYKDIEDDYIYEVTDNKIVKVINNNENYTSDEIMQLNDNVDKYDITIKDSYSTNTWNATLEESSSHVKYLQDKGYNITRQVCTQEFIDIHLSKNNDTKRVVIFPDKILVSSIEPKEFIIENYIK